MWLLTHSKQEIPFFITIWLFLMFAVTILHAQWWFIDEEFFIVCAFFGFLAYIHSVASSGIAEGLDSKIVAIRVALTSSRHAALQTLARMFDFYQIKDSLSPMEKQLRVGLATDVALLPLSRHMDYQFLVIQRAMQKATFLSSVEEDFIRVVALREIVGCFIHLDDPVILAPYVSNLTLNNLPNILLDRRASHLEDCADQEAAVMAFLAIDADCVSLA